MASVLGRMGLLNVCVQPMSKQYNGNMKALQSFNIFITPFICLHFMTNSCLTKSNRKNLNKQII